VRFLHAPVNERQMMYLTTYLFSARRLLMPYGKKVDVDFRFFYAF